MDWRRPIEQQKPVAEHAVTAMRRRERMAADDIRRAGSDPQMLELAVQARAYTERLRREGRKL
jgi:hypothetical protein